MISESRSYVVYLIGAGASHGCVTRAYSGEGILMRDLAQPLIDELREVVVVEFQGDRTLANLMNEVDEDTDFEHIITFLDESPSRAHQDFARRVREKFYEVLSGRLHDIRNAVGDDPVDLYAALLDMYEIPGLPEELQGIITLNYDNYIEVAARQISIKSVDYGFNVEGTSRATDTLQLLKLHGSFGWDHTWPTRLGEGEVPLWIPPGIQKEKQAYPFNVIWGLAREMLHCDVVRVIGCRLGSNDWDLISLLFASRYVSSRREPCRIEIIDSPNNAARIQEEFPYLDAQSIYDAQFVGASIANSCPSNPNWFYIWLKEMAEHMNTNLDSITTASGQFEELLEGG